MRSEISEILPGTALEADRVVPGVSLIDVAGEQRTLWDFRQRAALAVCFLHDRCEPCGRYATALAEEREDIREADAIALAIVGEPAELDVPVFVDPRGRARQRFLGPEGELPLILIVDRFGAALTSFPAGGHSFPGPEEVVATLRHLALQCPECGAPGW